LFSRLTLTLSVENFSRSTVRYFSEAVQPFDLIRSKIFFSRSTSTVRYFSEAVQLFDFNRLLFF